MRRRKITADSPQKAEISRGTSCFRVQSDVGLGSSINMVERRAANQPNEAHCSSADSDISVVKPPFPRLPLLSIEKN